MKWRIGAIFWAALAGAILLATPAQAQDNYEIQVYGADTVEPGHTMVELHSNFTIDGSKEMVDGLYPTNHAEHETIEITHGFTDWFETGFYIFTSARSGQGWQWVGDHIRPRFRVPEKWHWLYGLNPMAGVIEGFRWSLTGRGDPPGRLLMISSGVVVVVLLGGVAFFQKMETNVADVV